MKLMPIVYVTDMNRAITFYTALGLQVGAKGRSNYWTELTMGDGILALHFVESLPEKQIGRIELARLAVNPAAGEQVEGQHVRPSGQRAGADAQ